MHVSLWVKRKIVNIIAYNTAHFPAVPNCGISSSATDIRECEADFLRAATLSTSSPTPMRPRAASASPAASALRGEAQTSGSTTHVQGGLDRPRLPLVNTLCLERHAVLSGPNADTVPHPLLIEHPTSSPPAQRQTSLHLGHGHQHDRDRAERQCSVRPGARRTRDLGATSRIDFHRTGRLRWQPGRERDRCSQGAVTARGLMIPTTTSWSEPTVTSAQQVEIADNLLLNWVRLGRACLRSISGFRIDRGGCGGLQMVFDKAGRHIQSGCDQRPGDARDSALCPLTL
jgi:hypothetical protein